MAGKFNIDRLSLREKYWLIFAGMFFFASIVNLLAGFWIMPVIRDVEDKIKKVEGELGVNLSYARQEPAVSSEYKNVSAMLGQTTSDTRAIDEMKGEVDDLARKHRIDVPSMEDREPRRENYYCTEYVMEISRFEADTKDLLGFLQSVEKAPGLLRVTRLSVSPGKSRTRLKGSMQLTKVMLNAASK